MAVPLGIRDTAKRVAMAALCPFLETGKQPQMAGAGKVTGRPPF